MLLLLFAPQPAGGGGGGTPEVINFSVVLGDLIPQLNAAGSNDLIFWTTDELFAWFDEAAQRLARQAGIFVSRDTSLTSVLNQGPYALPANQVSTIQADIGGFVLRPATVQELEALDAAWPTTIGNPQQFMQDKQGLNLIVLYPAPGSSTAGETIGLVIHNFPPTISASNVFLNAPTVLQDYFKFYALGEARAKECKGAMQEMAQWFQQLTGLYEQTIEQYWGTAQ